MKKQSPNKIRWGIIGLGHIAHKFSKDLSTVNGAVLVAVASRSQEKAEIFAEKFDVEYAYSSYELLVKNPFIDAVYIATPHSFHKEHTILCLQHKKAVLCEKPFAMNSDQVNEMIAQAQKNNTLLMEALWTFFLPQYQHVIRLIQSQSLGKLIKIEADFGFQPVYDSTHRLFSKKVGGGSLLDIGIYPIFVAVSVLGIPDKILAKATFFESGVDSECKIIFSYDDNVKVYLKSTFLEDTPTEAIFTCEKGIIKINSRFHQPSTVSILQNNTEKLLDYRIEQMGYNFEIEHFNQLLRDHKTESNIMSFSFSRKLAQTLDRVRKKINLSYESID